ncbi:MAG: hypothetical protein KatS3mg026_0111 [Bacteroidia bacterium]|nr:MAG: hypothetical protein KatS3mg026_0111 [Bacteroidia bacterium]
MIGAILLFRLQMEGMWLWVNHTGLPHGYVAKLDRAGNVQWEHSIGEPGSEIFSHAYSITPVSDGGYVVLGDIIHFGAGEGGVYVIKLSNEGKVQWERTLGGEDAGATPLYRLRMGAMRLRG